MPSTDYIRDIVKKKRNVLIGHTPEGIKDIPDFLRFDSRGNPFLHYDSSFEDNERFIIFSSVFKKKYIEKVKVLVIDGTFKSSAQEFYQVVIIHGFIFGKTYPLIYTPRPRFASLIRS